MRYNHEKVDTYEGTRERETNIYIFTDKCDNFVKEKGTATQNNSFGIEEEPNMR